MKSKSIKIITLLAVAVILCAMLASCGLFGGTGETNKPTNNGVKTIYVNIYNVSGYTDSDFVDSSGRLRIPAKEPVRTGYVFDGWYLDEACTQPVTIGKKADQVVNIYPLFKVKTISVILRDSKNGNQKITVNYGEKLEIVDPIAAGFMFDGWYIDENFKSQFDIKTSITEETVIYAKWKPATFTIYYVLGEEISGLQSDTYTVGENFTLPSPTKDDYKFDGWYLDEKFGGERVTDLSGISGDKVLYAKFLCDLADMYAVEGISESVGEDEFKFYTDYTEHSLKLTDFFDFSDNAEVTVKLNGETVVGGTVNIAENTNIDGSEIVYTYSVIVTSESGDETNTYTVNVYQYDQSTVTVTYKVDGTTLFTDTVSRGGYVDAPYVYAVDKKGYEFSFWSAGDGEEYKFEAPITENLVLNAVFEAKKYPLAFSLGAAGIEGEIPTEYTVESIAPSAPTLRTGYTFGGWYLDEAFENAFTSFADLETLGAVTLYARYGKEAYWNFTSTGTEDREGETYIKFSVSKEDYPRFLDYCLFMKYEYVKVEVSGLSEMSAEELEEFYATEEGSYSRDHGIGFSYSSEECWLHITNYIDAINTSTTGTYTQLDFVKYAKQGNRDNSFNDFAVDHISSEMSVRGGEELYFALEKGYRPVPETGSVAEEVYNEIKDILRQIIGNDFSEKDKVLAIAEYLVENVAYDNYALKTFGANLGSSEAKTYRCFNIEGAILDKIAVCDGISKAFGAMCAVEGIDAVRVNGTKGGTPHAWNKVFVDLDGDGTREWSVVDCTAANTEVETDRKKGEGIEIINHSFIMTTDDLIVEKNLYVYDEKWAGLYEATAEYDIHSDVTIGELNCLADTKAELVALISAYRARHLEAEDKLVMDICVRKSIIYKNGSVDATAFVEAGFTADDINSGKFKPFVSEARDDDYVTLIFFFEK